MSKGKFLESDQIFDFQILKALTSDHSRGTRVAVA